MQSFYRSIMALDYELRLPSYLAKCINIDRPELHCNGQCELMKRVKDQEKKDAKKNIVVYESSALYTVNLLFDFNFLLHNSYRKADAFTASVISYNFQYHSSIFHPPSLV